MLFTINVLNAQLTLSPNPLSKSICPNVNTTFTVSGINSNCTGFTFSVTSGQTNAFSSTGNSFTINPKSVSQIVEVTFFPGSNRNCNSTQVFKIPVTSIIDVGPQISNCPVQLVVGKSHQINLTATLNQTEIGSNDQNEVPSYEWTIISGGNGWSLSTTNAPGVLRKKVSIITDNCSDAIIRVVGVDKCGNRSAPSICTITRIVEPASISSSKSFVVCCNKDRITIVANQPTSGLSGYNYSWTLGDWTGENSGSDIRVFPSGNSNGVIKLTTTACGKSITQNLNIPLNVIDPTTNTIGDKYLCTGEIGTFKLDKDIEPCANASWEVIPHDAVVNYTGNGTIALLEPYLTGKAQIVFKIETPCGNVERKFDFYVGKPVLILTNYDFNRAPYPNPWEEQHRFDICPSLEDPSHWFDIFPIGAFGDKIDKVDDHGTTQNYIVSGNQIDWTIKQDKDGNFICADFTIYASNECGTTAYDISFCPNKEVCKRRNDWWHWFKIYPNPASSNASISLMKQKGSIIENVNIPYLEVYDRFGNLIKTYKNLDNVFNLQVDDLHNGQYFIKTIIDDETISEQLFIQK
jgi:Secretion system C-terminal sorting domain